ncbi:hypothetical protein LSH36_845g01012 [Paralvinella palmiformis]|uniref:Sugar phosphate exchanger 3 n=1 Tax=Paralvinella palmiformis TaxID=53620 RepID=A0AAD9IYN0_9ANNE|nr:hypothetical protein LSH36_845g01012 [Paralvinella palmiformis]
MQRLRPAFIHFDLACTCCSESILNPSNCSVPLQPGNQSSLFRTFDLTDVVQNGTTHCGWAPFDGKDGNELLGYMDIAFLFPYALGMFISGHIAERVSLRYFLSAGMLMSGTTVALFGLAAYWKIHHVAYFLAVQILGGFAQSTGWPTVVTCVANWFGKGKRGLIMGLWNSHTSFGNIIGSLIAGGFAEDEWGLSFIVPGAIIAALGIFVFFFLVPHPHDVGCVLESDQREIIARHTRSSDISDSGNIQQEGSPLLNEDVGTPTPETKAITFCAALKIPKNNSCANLIPAQFNAEISADLSTVFDFGGIIGGVIAGVLSDKLIGRATMCNIMLLIAAPMLFVYEGYRKASIAVNITLLFICGFLVNGPYALITTAVSADLGTHSCLHGNAKALATVTAIIDGTGSLGAAVGPLLAGLFSSKSWHDVFYMLIAADFIALLLLMRLVKKEIQKSCSSETRAIHTEEI